MTSTLLEKIKASSCVKKEVKWPGADEVINLRVLNDNDYLQATLAADKLFTESKIAVHNLDAYNSELETQYLFRSIQNPETNKQLFSNITDFRNVLTPEIKNHLADQLDALHEEYSPDPNNMSDEDFDKLLNDVKKNAKATVGTVSNIFIARKLITYLVDQPEK